MSPAWPFHWPDLRRFPPVAHAEYTREESYSAYPTKLTHPRYIDSRPNLTFFVYDVSHYDIIDSQHESMSMGYLWLYIGLFVDFLVAVVIVNVIIMVMQ